MNLRCRLVQFCIARLLIILVAVAIIMGEPPVRAGTSEVTIGGPFTLSTPDGTTVTDRTYRGKWLLVYFGYTFCPTSCPTTLLAVTRALEELGHDAAQVQPLFITVDPQRDTPKVMRQYTESFDPRIVGLTGTPQQIATAAQEYGAYYVRHSTGAGPDDYVVDHSTYLYLMDPLGKFVRAFDSDTSGDWIADVLRALIGGRSQGTNEQKETGQFSWSNTWLEHSSSRFAVGCRGRLVRNHEL
jgi:protein SCO1/2